MSINMFICCCFKSSIFLGFDSACRFFGLSSLADLEEKKRVNPIERSHSFKKIKFVTLVHYFNIKKLLTLF